MIFTAKYPFKHVSFHVTFNIIIRVGVIIENREFFFVLTHLPEYSIKTNEICTVYRLHTNLGKCASDF